MAKTLMTVFLVVFFFVISQDIVISETTCSSVSECAHMTCHTGYPRCLRGICRCHPEDGLASAKITSCKSNADCPIDLTKCIIGIPICVGGTCRCGEHKDALANDHIPCKTSFDCEDIQKCEVGFALCADGICTCSD